MNLRERKFVNYIETTVRIKHNNHPSVTYRKRANSERCENKSTCQRKNQESTPAVKRRATATLNNSKIPANSLVRDSAPMKKDANSQKMQVRSKTTVTRSRSVPQKTSKTAARRDAQPSIFPQRSIRTRSVTVQLRSLPNEAKTRSLSQRSSVSNKNEIIEQSGKTNNEKQTVKVTRRRTQTATIKTKKRNGASRRKYKNRQDGGCGNDNDNLEDMNESSNDEMDSDSDDFSEDNECTSSKNKSKRQNEIHEFMNQQFFERRYRQLLPIPRSDPPSEFHEMQKIWSNLILCLTSEGLLSYKKGLIRLLTGRVSSLQPLQEIFPTFPNELRASHHRLYSLLCQCSGAYPFKNHEGSRLVSQQKLADTSQIGAQIIVESLYNRVIPFDISRESNILSQIETYVRIGIKDMLEEAVKQLPEDRNTITAADIKESLSSRLLS